MASLQASGEVHIMNGFHHSVLQCKHLHVVLTSDAQWLSGVPPCHWKVGMIFLSMTNIWVVIVMGPT